MDPLLLSLISACTALVASIVGPIVTLLVARRQFAATVLSANRQKWIESLREALAELISLLVTALVVKSGWKEEWDSGRGPVNRNAALLEKVQRMVLTQSRIHLLINPTEGDHQHLCAAVDAALARLRSNAFTEAETEKDIGIITQMAQTILKREWQRVKHGT
jgi:predicted NBD/HSP70 family sugar kinase